MGTKGFGLWVLGLGRKGPFFSTLKGAIRHNLVGFGWIFEV